jgi:uncharacterized protein
VSVFIRIDLTSASPRRRDDEKHSKGEERFYALGQTDAARFLFVVFTTRAQRIRIISARDMSRKERKVYQSS